MRKVFVGDVTLRSDAANKLSFREKMRLISLIDSLGTDFIELPQTDGSRESEIVADSLAGALKSSRAVITAAADTESVARAVVTAKSSENPVIMIELPVSTVSMEYEYHLKDAKMLALAEKLVCSAKESEAQIELCLKDASRADASFIIQLAELAKSLDVFAITVCDDAGVFLPDEVGSLVKEIKSNCDINVFVSLSNAMGMAVAAAAAAILNGADGVKVNAAECGLDIGMFSELIRVRGEVLDAECSLDVTKLHHTVAEIKMCLEGRQTAAKSVSTANGDVVLTKDSNLEELAKAVKALGYELSDADIGSAFEEMKRVSRKKDSIGAKELEAIIATACMQVPSTYHLESYISNSGNIIPATANITLTKDGEKLSGVASGDGPIDASFRAIENIIGHHYELDDFKITSVTEGREAVGSAIVKLRADGKLYSGNGISTDIIGASIRAYVNALNKIVYSKE